MRRQYAGAAFASVLTAELAASALALTIDCDDLTNWPDGVVGPFYVVIDRGLPTEEKILCSSRAGNTLAVYDNGITNGRGSDSTSISYHNVNSVIEHVFTATDADEANAHVNSPALHITAATTTTRPSPAVANQVVLQTDAENLIGYVGGSWVDLSGAGAQGGGSDKVFWENDVIVSEDYSITSGKNAGTFGPVTIDTGVTVTVPSGSVWTVV